MSHLTKYKSQVLVNPVKLILEKTAKEMGMSLDYNIKKVRNTWVHADVDAAFIKDGKRMSIGIKINEEKGKKKADIVGDFYDTGYFDQEFIDQFSQLYKKNEVIMKCSQMGWSIDTNSIYVDDKTNEIVIDAYRYVV